MQTMSNTTYLKATLFGFVFAFLVCVLVDSSVAIEPARMQRRPVSSVLTRDNLLCVANSVSGSISVVDAKSRKLIQEISYLRNGQAKTSSLTDIATIPKTNLLIATDAVRHQLHLLEVTTRHQVPTPTLEKRHSLDVEKFPVGVALSPSGKMISVASGWSRRLTVVDLNDDFDDARHLQVRRVVDLGFAPRMQQFIDEQHVVVFDGFGGQIAVVDVCTGKTIQTINTPWHNIRGVGLSGTGEIIVAHQILSSSAHTEREHIHWGVLLENQVSTFPIAKLLKLTKLDAARKSNGLKRPFGNPRSVGEAGDAAGDPGAIALTKDRMYVVLSGTNQIALIDRVGVRELRAKVGVRPVDVAYDAKTRRVFVVNALDDSISVVDSTDPRSVKRIQLGPELELTAVDRGERLFFDARLSLDGWMSCHSCHTNGHSAHRLADTMGDGLFGNPKRIPSLLGTSQSGPWAWNGSKKRLMDQLKESLTDTMHGPNSSAQTVSDLSSYLASLKVPQSINESRGDVSESRWASGKELFKNRGCVECHAGPLYTSRATFDVGIKDEKGQTRFNPPSLLGVSQRDRLLHDGRADSLQDVLLKVKHELTDPLSKQDAADLVYFLKSL